MHVVAPTVATCLQRFTLFDHGAQGMDTGLAAKLMETTSTFAELCRDIKAAASDLERLALGRYIAFAKEERDAAPGNTWATLSPASAAPATAAAPAAARIQPLVFNQPLPSARSQVRNPVMAAFLIPVQE